MRRRIRVIQDGREFYNDETCDLLFQSSVLVSDGDIEAAQDARQEFLDFAEREGFEVEFCGP